MSTVSEAPYSGIAKVYDRWMAADKIPYEQWYEFTSRRFAEADAPVRSVIDICCGTGVTVRRLQNQGYRVTGVDASPEMLAIARQRTDPGTALIPITLPSPALSTLGTFDAALICFDGANYLTAPGALLASLSQIAAILRPGGILVFDLSTRLSFESIAAMGQFGEDFGDFAYLWRTRHEPDSPVYDYEVTLFVEEAGHYTRVVEHHTQRWFAQPEVHTALTTAGFTAINVHDNYTDHPTTSTTRRHTWSAHRV